MLVARETVASPPSFIFQPWPQSKSTPRQKTAALGCFYGSGSLGVTENFNNNSLACPLKTDSFGVESIMQWRRADAGQPIQQGANNRDFEGARGVGVDVGGVPAARALGCNVLLAIVSVRS
jgi:hypothetical protein